MAPSKRPVFIVFVILLPLIVLLSITSNNAVTNGTSAVLRIAIFDGESESGVRDVTSGTGADANVRKRVVDGTVDSNDDKNSGDVDKSEGDADRGSAAEKEDDAASPASSSEMLAAAVGGDNNKPREASQHRRAGFVVVDGDAAGHGPRHLLLKLVSEVPIEKDSDGLQEEARTLAEASARHTMEEQDQIARRTAELSLSDAEYANSRSFLEVSRWRSLPVNTASPYAFHESGDKTLTSEWFVTYNRTLSRPVPAEFLLASQESEAFFKAIEDRGVLPLVANSSQLIEGPLEGRDMVRLGQLGGNAAGEASPIYSNPITSEAEEPIVFNKIANANAFAKSFEDLEFVKGVKAVDVWLRPLNETVARWKRRDEALINGKRANSGPHQRRRAAVRVACLYAGFVRDYIRMYISCMDKVKSVKKCKDKYVYKLYGSQKENIVDSSGCDVYSSTWDIVGTGRYDVKDYKMDVKFNIDQLKFIYGERLGGLHVQRYSVYERVWKYMATRARSFPQTRPVHSTKFPATWKGTHENNFIFRVNDYSQSYKHWCVVQLALLSRFNYDVFFRLRMDLRAVREITNFRFAVVDTTSNQDDFEEKTRALKTSKTATTSDIAEMPSLERRAIAFDISDFKEDSGVPLGLGAEHHITQYKTHHLTRHSMHVQNFDYADFGFMATPSLIHAIAAVWYYCLMPPVKGLPLQHLGPQMRPASEVISEYNLVVWRIIWENRLKIDSGAITLRISRRAEVKGKVGKKRRR